MLTQVGLCFLPALGLQQRVLDPIDHPFAALIPAKWFGGWVGHSLLLKCSLGNPLDTGPTVQLKGGKPMLNAS